MTLRERWAAFSPRERYLVLGALAIALLVVIRYAPVPSFGSLTSSGEENWVQLQKIENYQKILGRSDAAEKQLQELQERYDAARNRLVPGSTPTQVGAALQGKLSQMASDAGLNVLSSQILKDETYGDFRRVGVRMTLSGELDGVTKMLSAIETGPADVSVTLLEINRKLGASRRPPTARGAAPLSAAATLTATLEVKTFMQESL
jgi:hypothetical protein